MCTITKQCRTGFIKMKDKQYSIICTDNSPKLLTFQYPCDQVKLWVHCSDMMQMHYCVALTIKVSGLHGSHSGVHNVMLITGYQDFWASEPTRAENKSNRFGTV